MELKECWAEWNDPGRPLLEQDWPEEKRLGFLDALAELAPEAGENLKTTYRITRAFGDVPILAVAGPINGGKSSLVGAFLSAESRERIPRGLGSRDGTQRFVLWTPRSWLENPELRGRLEGMLRLVFRNEPEMLAEDPAESRRQYADVDVFSRPLLASDPDLDHHGLALLDCPDMQRLQANEREGENLRLEAIVRAAEICAGIILVTPRAQLEVRDLAELVRCRLPRALRVYAVNLIRPPEPPDSVYRELSAALKTEPEPICYGAYDYLVPASFEFSPAWDPNRERADEERLPCFFRISTEAAENRPERVGEDRSILRLADAARPAALRQKRQRELLGDLARQAREGVEALEKRAAADVERTQQAARELYSLVHDLMHDADGRLRIKMDPAIVVSFKTSMERTAPVHLKPVMALRRRMVDRALDALRHGRVAVSRVFPWMNGERPYRQLKERLQKRLIQERDIEKLLERWAASLRTGSPERTWEAEAADVLKRYREEESTNMDPEDWDSLTSEIWRNTNPFKATVKIFGSFFAGLAAVILIPFDGGASVLGITALELLGVLGFGGLVAAGTLRKLEDKMKEKIGYRQFANLLAIAGDRLGVPRACLQEVLRENDLVDPAMPELILPNSFGIAEAGWRICRVDRKAGRHLLERIESCEREDHVRQAAS